MPSSICTPVAVVTRTSGPTPYAAPAASITSDVHHDADNADRAPTLIDAGNVTEPGPAANKSGVVAGTTTLSKRYESVAVIDTPIVSPNSGDHTSPTSTRTPANAGRSFGFAATDATAFHQRATPAGNVKLTRDIATSK